jgi:uncharacterized membrane protein YcaP (DUF421 family)
MPLFESWLTLGRAALTTVLLFGLLLAGVRLVGKRVTTHMNNFDWIVTVAVGALLAKTILIEEVTLAEGSVAVVTLLVLQFAATKAATRFSFAECALLSRPTLLFYGGTFVEEALRRERVTQAEVRSAVRAAGHASLGEVAAVVLEPSGKVSILDHEAFGEGNLLDEL